MKRRGLGSAAVAHKPKVMELAASARKLAKHAAHELASGDCETAFGAIAFGKSEAGKAEAHLFSIPNRQRTNKMYDAIGLANGDLNGVINSFRRTCLRKR